MNLDRVGGITPAHDGMRCSRALPSISLKVNAELFQDWVQVFAKVASSKQLIARIKNTNPKKMDVVRHAAINRATQPVTKHRVRENLAKLVVEDRD
jgi:hypothetical protein